MRRHLTLLASLGAALCSGSLRAQEISLRDAAPPLLPPATQAKPASPSLAELTVPLDFTASGLRNTTLALYHLMKGVALKENMPPTGLVRDGHYILCGDLFHTHDIFALVQLGSLHPANAESDPPLVALAVWCKDGWGLRGLWKIPVTWRPEGWQSSESDPLPDTPATKAFALKDLSGDGVPEVIIAGGVGEYYQDLYVLRFDPGEKTLRLLATSRDEPLKLGKYVMLYDKSEGHPIWGDWKYYEWAGADLVPVAVWHDQVPFDGVGDTFLEATAFAKKGAAAKYHLVEARESPKENVYTITRDGEPYATLTFAWRKGPDDNDVPSYANVERAYLFRKLLGLPMSAYPLDETNTPPAFFEKYGTLKVSGADEAVKQLGMEKAR